MKTTMKMKTLKYNNRGLGVIALVMIMLLPLGEIMAQNLRVNLMVNSRPSAYLSEWYRPQNGMLILSTMKGEEVERMGVRFETEIMNEDDQVIYTLPVTTSMPVQVVGSTVTFPLSDVLQLQNGKFADARMMNSFAGSGKLAAGQYTMRVRVWHGAEEYQLSEWTPPKVFMIFSYQLPTLVVPADGQELDIHKAKSVITFRWTPVTADASVVKYRIQIWRVLPNQTPMQTMRSTPPIEDRLVRGTTQFIWRPQLNMIDDDVVETNQFIWAIQTLDEMDLPVETTDPSMNGYSEPAVFTVADLSKREVE